MEHHPNCNLRSESDDDDDDGNASPHETEVATS